MYYYNDQIDVPKRFDLARFLEYDEDAECYDILTSYLCNYILDETHDGIFVVSSEEGRPELVSYKIYRDTQYWWILMYYNGLLSYEEVQSDMNLKYLRLPKLESYVLELRSKSRVGVTKDFRATTTVQLE